MHVLHGTEPSYYTAKARIALGLLGVPHRFALKTLDSAPRVETGAGGYRRFPVLELADGRWLTDSTDIALAMDAATPGASLLPADPALAWLVRLADDWLDEWLLRAALAWRFADPPMRRHAARVGALNLVGRRLDEAHTPADDAAADRLVPAIEGFFLRSAVVQGWQPGMEARALSFARAALAALGATLARRPFLMGEEPGLADAALWGFVHSGFLLEPAAADATARAAPALVAFHARLRLARAVARDTTRLEDAAPALAGWLAGDALGFAPFAGTNRAAVAAGTDGLLDGRAVPARPFLERCRARLAADFAALAAHDRARLHALGWPLVAAYAA